MVFLDFSQLLVCLLLAPTIFCQIDIVPANCPVGHPELDADGNMLLCGDGIPVDCPHGYWCMMYAVEDGVPFGACCPRTDECPVEWTQWFDRDNPSGTGDWETMSNLQTEYPNRICPNPYAIEVQTLDGQPAITTGEIFLYYNPTNGFACRMVDQPDNTCLDYKVRFCCYDDYPEPVCDGEWTEWYNVDDPEENELGDIETLSRLCDEHDICPRPSAVQAKSITTGLPAELTGEIFHSYDVINGFACLNEDQDDHLCENYRVRFCCPDSIDCDHWTKWMDKDNPGGTGDWETIPDLGDAYPGTMCDNPVAIEVVTVDGIPADQTGEVFLFMDVIRGFACVNKEQPDHRCLDYKVRFCCDDSDSKPGECPVVAVALTHKRSGICYFQCRDDFDCPGREKCCQDASGCGTTCMAPIFPCFHEGVMYTYPDTRDDDCNVCHCELDGNWACTLIYCGPPDVLAPAEALEMNKAELVDAMADSP